MNNDEAKARWLAMSYDEQLAMAKSVPLVAGPWEYDEGNKAWTRSSGGFAVGRIHEYGSVVYAKAELCGGFTCARAQRMSRPGVVDLLKIWVNANLLDMGVLLDDSAPNASAFVADKPIMRLEIYSAPMPQLCEIPVIDSQVLVSDQIPDDWCTRANGGKIRLTRQLTVDPIRTGIASGFRVLAGSRVMLQGTAGTSPDSELELGTRHLVAGFPVIVCALRFPEGK